VIEAHVPVFNRERFQPDTVQGTDNTAGYNPATHTALLDSADTSPKIPSLSVRRDFLQV